MDCNHKTRNLFRDKSTYPEKRRTDGQPYMIYGHVSMPYNK